LEEKFGVIEARFDEVFNEVYPKVVFGQMSYDPADVFKAVDPIAYRCEVADFESSQEDN
jgi:hypothetical protein